MTRARDVANVLSTATTLATDTETAAAISSHNSSTTTVHGITDTAALATSTSLSSAISTHASAADPHSVYLKESEYVAAGKNKIINGDFRIWQRGISFSNVSGYAADRWQFSWGGTSTSNITREDLPIGSIPGGNESLYFARYTRTTTVGDDYLLQRVEDVRTLLGKTVTFSFWAKANVATTISQVYGATSYGSGGSAGSGFGNFSGIAIGTTWDRYSFTGTVESGVGKTIGANSFTELVFKFGTAMGNIVVDIWGVQLEVGSTVTNFTTATGTIQGELAACQRYFQTILNSSEAVNNFENFGIGLVWATNRVLYNRIIPVTMRVAPSISLSAVGDIAIENSTVGAVTATNHDSFDQSPRNFSGSFYCAGTPFTIGQGARLRANGTANARIYLAAEL